MKHHEVASAVVRVISSVLKHDVQPPASRSSELDWDSLNHVEIIFSLEEYFNFEFPRELIGELDSVEALIDAILRFAPDGATE